MRRAGLFLAGILLSLISLAQGVTRPRSISLGIHFLFNDFVTPAELRSSSLREVLRENRMGKLKDMPQGLALSYAHEISERFDFTAMLSGSFLSYPLERRPAPGTTFLLLEADAGVRGRLLPQRYWLTPFASAGVGMSKYQGYWGAYIPAGIGLQLNFFDEAYLYFQSQYRLGITETTSHHVVHAIGLAGNIGRRRP